MALRENKLSFFLPWQLQSCGCADQQSRIIPGTGKNFKRVRQLLSLTLLHEKIQVLVDPVNTCVRDTQPKRIIVENHGHTFFKRCKMLRR